MGRKIGRRCRRGCRRRRRRIFQILHERFHTSRRDNEIDRSGCTDGTKNNRQSTNDDLDDVFIVLVQALPLVVVTFRGQHTRRRRGRGSVMVAVAVNGVVAGRLRIKEKEWVVCGEEQDLYGELVGPHRTEGGAAFWGGTNPS